MRRHEPVGAGDLTFRRQFALGPAFPDLLPTWERHTLAEGLCLSAHPDLPVTRVEADGRSLTLLGFVLDPRHPERDDETILQLVLRETRTFDETVAAFGPLGGRWAVVHVAGDEASVVHDPAGTRAVYHGRDGHDGVWCGSSATLVARVAGQPEDPEHRAELLDSGVLAPHLSHFWPGTATAYRSVERLLPNHRLDVRTGRAERYWPRGPLAPVSFEEATETGAAMLAGSIEAAARRFPLAMGATAGLDSRLLMAASRGCSEPITYYTLLKAGMTRHSPDVRIPRAMLRRTGRTHRVIPVPPETDGPVATAIRDTFVPWHESTARSAQALSVDPPRSDGPWLTVNGNVSEIARLGYPRIAPTAENFAHAAKVGDGPVAVEQFRAWYAGAAPAIAGTGIDPWEIFYWEHRIGAWLGTVRTEFDVVEEGYTPYNCRALLETFLGVDPSRRGFPDSELYRSLITHLWPELLDHPVNPPTSRLKATIKARVPEAILARRADKSAWH